MLNLTSDRAVSGSISRGRTTVCSCREGGCSRVTTTSRGSTPSTRTVIPPVRQLEAVAQSGHTTDRGASPDQDEFLLELQAAQALGERDTVAACRVGRSDDGRPGQRPAGRRAASEISIGSGTYYRSPWQPSAANRRWSATSRA